MRKKKIKILHVAQAAGGVDRYIRMLLKYLDKEKFENIYYRENSFMNKVELPAVTAERVLGMIALRETTRKLLDCQLHDGSDAEVQLLQNELKQQSALRHKPQWFRLLLTSYQRK